MLNNIIVSLVASIAFVSGSLAQDIIFVDKDAIGLNDGSSWENAHTSIEVAILMTEAGDQVWVAEGISHPLLASERPDAWSAVRPGVEVYGGFRGSEVSLFERSAQAHTSKISSQLLEWIKQNWTANGWENNSRLEVLFDESGQANGSVDQTWDGTDWVTRVGSRIVSELDTEGNEWKVTEKLEAGVWIRFSRTHKIHDESGELVERVSQIWQDSVWVYTGRSLFERNSGLVVKQTHQRWNGSEWYDTQIDHYSYDEQGNKTEFYALGWTGQAMEKVHRIEYSYDAAGHLIDQMEQREKGGDWVNDERRSQAFDAMGRRTGLVLMNWFNEVWDNDEQIVTEYDDATREHRNTWYDSDQGTMDWTPNYRWTYRDDEQGRSISSLGQDWKDGFWQDDTRSTSSYDDDKRIEEWFDEYWANDMWNRSVEQIWTRD